MLNVAMVLMILAGVFGLPAAACSSACAGLGAAAGAHKDPGAAGGQAIMESLMWLAILASIGSIVIGAMVRKMGKVPAGITSLAFALIFVLLLIQANPLGLPSAFMLLIAAVMIFVAPRPEYTGITKVEITK